jgi:predicted Zn-dependent protease
MIRKIVILFGITVLMSSSSVKEQASFAVALVKVDGRSIKELKEVKKYIRDYYMCDVAILNPITLTKECFKNSQDTLLPLNVLDHISTLFKDGKHFKYIAITEKPLYFSQKYKSIRGQGTLNGMSCIVSTYKIKDESNGNTKLYKNFLIKVSRHELGHTLGLDHCESDPKCFMIGGTVAEKFYAANTTLCKNCNNKVAEYIR